MDWWRREWDAFQRSAHHAVAVVRHGIHRASWHHTLLLLFGVVMSVCCAGAQTIFLNLLIADFPSDPVIGRVGGPYTVLLSSGLSSLLLYILVGAAWAIRYRPPVASCLFNPQMWLHCGAAGALWTANGFLVVFATPHTPEVLQAIMMSSQIVWTLLFAAAFRINHGKNYCHALVIAALSLSVVGVILGVLATSGGVSRTEDPGVWIFLFALGIVPGALTNVIAARFMQRCAYDEDNDGDDVNANDADAGASAAAATPTDDVTGAGAAAAARRRTGAESPESPLIDVDRLCDDDRDGEASGCASARLRMDIGTAKLMFLLVGSLSQVVTTVGLMPLDWAPFFGPDAGNKTFALQRLHGGFQCIFNVGGGDSCRTSMLYFAFFAVAFAGTNAGNVIVSQFSAPLCGMVAQVALPLTGLVMQIFPSWSPYPLQTNAPKAIAGVVLIVAGSACFSFWEQMSSEEKWEEAHGGHAAPEHDDGVGDHEAVSAGHADTAASELSLNKREVHHY